MDEENDYRKKRIDLDGVKMNVVEIGNGYPIVLVHGWTNNWKGFIPIAKILSEKYRVIMIDLLGYGDSDQLEKYSIKIEAEYLKKLVDELNLDRFCLGALSMGTYVISKFYELYPKRAEKIILISPTFEKNSKKMFVSGNFFRMVQKNNLANRVVKKIVDRKLYAYAVSKFINMHHFDWEMIKKYGMEGKRKMTGKVYVDIGLDMSRNNIAEMITNNQKPIKIIFGKFDKLCNLEKTKKVLRCKGNYEFVSIDGSGHLVNVEKPQQVAQEIDNFISGK